MLKYNKSTESYECVECGQEFLDDIIETGKEDGWAFCPCCGEETDFNID